MCLVLSAHSNTVEMSAVGMNARDHVRHWPHCKQEKSHFFQSSCFSKWQLINLCQAGPAAVNNTSESRDSEYQRLLFR